jgi:hypothetical protein
MATATATVSTERLTFVSKRIAAQAAGVNPARIQTLVDAGLVRRRELPGSRPTYCLEDAKQVFEVGAG